MTGSVYRNKKYKARVGRVARGRPRRVFSEEEEAKFAAALHKRFNLQAAEEQLDWRTLRAVMQKHLQNLVKTNPSRAARALCWFGSGSHFMELDTEPIQGRVGVALVRTVTSNA